MQGGNYIEQLEMQAQKIEMKFWNKTEVVSKATKIK